VVPQTPRADNNGHGVNGRLSAARIAALVSGALLLVAPACGGADDGESAEPGVDEVIAAVEGLSGDARTRKLEELAEAESGDFSLYTSMTAGHDATIAEAFEEAHGVSVAVYRASTEAITQRLLEEEDVGFRGADVVDSNGVTMTVLAEREMLAPYDSPSSAGLVAGSPQDGWIESRSNSFVVSWNTELVPPGEQPRSWEDLADPRWRGKVAVEAGDADWYLGLRTYWIEEEGKSESEADRLFESIARNAVVFRGHSAVEQLLGAGEFHVVAANYLHIVKGSIEDGAPVAWEPAVEPVITRPEGVAVLRSARRPAAALLYVDWLLGPGQEVIAELGRDPARKDLLATGGAETVEIDTKAFVAAEEEWLDRFERLLRNAKQGEQSD
jgi:iron(III) transport system substrate-binding protein